MTEILAWLLTYAAHSTLLVALVWLLTASRLVRAHLLQDTLWKLALVGPLLTATVQTALDASPLIGRYALDSTPAAVESAAIAPAPIEPAIVAETPEPKTRTKASAEPAEPAEAAEPLPFLALEQEPVATAPATAPELPAAAAPVAVSPVASPPAAVPPAWPLTLVALWLVAAAFALLRLGFAWVRFSRRLGRRVPVESARLQGHLEALREAAGFRRPVRLTRAAGLASPIAIGSAEICLPPAALTELDDAQQRGVLAHELAHLARRDPLWLTGACLIERVFLFQPLNRLVRYRMQETAEYLCDDWAVRRTGSGLTLAKSLMKVAEWVQAAPHAVPVSGMAEGSSQLVTRVHRLVENRAMNTPVRSRWQMPLALALLALTAAAAPSVTTAQPERRPLQQADTNDRPAVAPRAHGRAHVTPMPMPMPTPTPTPTPRLNGIDIDLKGLRSVVASSVSKALDMKVDVAPVIAGGRVRMVSPQARDTNGDGRSVAVLVEALSDADAGVREAAAHALGQLEDPRAVDGLVRALRDGNARVREAAAHALGEIEDGRAAEGLGAALKDGDPKVRQQAAWALSNLEDRRAVEPLLAALKDGDVEVRRMATHALGSIEDPSAVDGLVAALKDADAEVRSNAAWALGELQDRRALPALGAALKDQNAEVRGKAAWAIGELDVSEAPAALLDATRDADAEVRKTAAWAIGETGDARAVPALRPLLDDGNAEVRHTAIWALGEIRGPAAMEALLGAMKAKDPEVRREAARALGQQD